MGKPVERKRRQREEEGEEGGLTREEPAKGTIDVARRVCIVAGERGRGKEKEDL